MDPRLAQTLTTIAKLLLQRAPGTAAEILAYVNGQGILSAATMMLIRPQLLLHGVDPKTLPVTPAATPNPNPVAPTSSGAIPDAPNDPGISGAGAVGGGRDQRTTPDQVSGAPGSPPQPSGRGIGSGGNNRGLAAEPVAPVPQLSTTTGPGVRDQNTTVNQVSGADPTQAPGTATTSPGGGGTGLPGGYSAAQGTVLAGDQNQLQRFALQAAGLNPDRMGRFGQLIAGMLAPLIAARRNAFGIQGGQNTGGLPQDIASFAKEFTTGGVDAFGNAQQYAQGVLNSPELRQYTSGLSNPDQAQAMYQSLMPLLFAGSNPLIQQSAADSAQRVQGQYNDQVFQNNGIDPNGGIFPQWLDANAQKFDPLTRRIFGLR